MRALVIAEIGSCHDRELSKALALVDAAAAAGADVVKAQFWSSADRLADRRRVPDEYRQIYRLYQMPADWLPVLHERCECHGVEFMCTTYLPEDVAVVAPFVQRFKISSFEAEAGDLIEAHRPFSHRAIVVSLGMAASRAAVTAVFRRARFLHCVSAYPAPLDEMQLSVLWSRDYAGLSDHSRQLDMGGLAVAAGAEIIEAHIRLDDTDPSNPDFATAFSPGEFAEYVANIRRVETIMGDGRKRLMPSEEPMSAFRVVAP